MTIHTVPTGDTRDGEPFDHEEETTCPCGPSVDFVDGGMYVKHNSFDGREAAEWADSIINPDSMTIHVHDPRQENPVECDVLTDRYTPREVATAFAAEHGYDTTHTVWDFQDRTSERVLSGWDDLTNSDVDLVPLTGSV